MSCLPNLADTSGCYCSQSKRQGRIGVDALMLRLRSDRFVVEERYQLGKRH